MTTLILLTATATLAVYLATCAYRPYLPCPSCGRTGERHGSLYPRAWGTCRRCSGTGRRKRLGARLLGVRDPDTPT